MAGGGSHVSAAGREARLEAVWGRIIELFPKYRGLWAAGLELTAQADRLPEVRARLVEAQAEGWRGMVSFFEGVEEDDVDEETARTLGPYNAALLNGVMMLRLFDEGTAPSARDLARAMESAGRLRTRPPSLDS
ncbi:hypothetical protein [Streptomyces sp. 7N604]|uniref:hypothetical protein n=1 Tax=Streptomyces sp. 7N604 TaxID=3457415 RepID=UPI003FD26C94